MKMRTASFNNAAALGACLPGTPVANLPVALMSFLLVAGDLDK
jgi:NADH:ubiquinone oxidoreductase subunit D